jgi:hypothetical protein
VIREVAKHIHLSPAVLITQIRTRVEGSGIPEAKALMRSTSALRQALEREKKKVRQLSGTVKNEWMSAEEEEEEQEGNPRFLNFSLFPYLAAGYSVFADIPVPTFIQMNVVTVKDILDVNSLLLIYST